MREIRTVVIHVSDTPDALDISARDIRRWHIQDNGWIDIGYHWVVCRDGEIEKGRPELAVGAGVAGFNRHSVHICWIGRNKIQDIQYHNMLELVAEIVDHYDLEIDDVLGHYELDKWKSCPNLDMDKVRKDLERYL